MKKIYLAICLICMARVYCQNITAAFTASPACADTLNCFISVSTSTNGMIVNYTWDFGDTLGYSAVQNPCYHYPHPGTHTVTLIVMNSSGDIDSTKQPVTTYPLPPLTCYANPDTINPGTTVSTLYSYSDGSADTYFWTPPYALSSQSGQFTSANPWVDTCYTVTVTDTNGCKNTCQACVYIDLTLKAQIISLEKVQLFPNPTSGSITISHSKKEELWLEITNAEGIVLDSKRVPNTTAEINIGHLKNGIYGYRILSAAGLLQNGKVIVIK